MCPNMRPVSLCLAFRRRMRNCDDDVILSRLSSRNQAKTAKRDPDVCTTHDCRKTLRKKNDKEGRLCQSK